MLVTGLSLDILKMESWTHMGRTANIIIKDVVIHIFASISKIMRILLMGRRNRERCVITSVKFQSYLALILISNFFNFQMRVKERHHAHITIQKINQPLQFLVAQKVSYQTQTFYEAVISYTVKSLI